MKVVFHELQSVSLTFDISLHILTATGVCHPNIYPREASNRTLHWVPSEHPIPEYTSWHQVELDEISMRVWSSTPNLTFPKKKSRLSSRSQARDKFYSTVLCAHNLAADSQGQAKISSSSTNINECNFVDSFSNNEHLYILCFTGAVIKCQDWN